MINADEIKNLTDIEMEILRCYIKGYNYVQVTYLFEKHTIAEINITKQMLLERRYKVDEVNIYANKKQVGVVLDIYW